jgi:hypothetical protein
MFASQFGEVGIGIGMGMSFIISSGIAFAYYNFGGWRHKQLFGESG